MTVLSAAAAGNFGWLDAIIILGYLATLTGIGAYFAHKQKDLEDFFLAGRSMGWLPVGMSLMAALNSGIDYLMGPFGVFQYGLIFLIGVGSWLLLYPWVSYVTLPFYRKLNVVSAYEYLELRFDSSVRTLAAVIFLLWRIGWMATALYVPALAISASTHLPLVPTIIVLGGAVTLYSMLGGITAIIWTDVLQFCIMLAGVAATLAIVVYKVPGGIAGIFEFANAHGRTRLFEPVPAGNFSQQLTFLLTDYRSVVGIILATMVGRMTIYTCEQSMVQRFQATRSLRDAKRAFIINAIGDALWTLGLAFTGLALYAYFRGETPAGVKGDEIVIYFMRTAFPSGLNGLVVAAVLASGLSAIDAAINAGTSVIMVDFYKRLFAAPLPADPQAAREQERREVKLSRILTVIYASLGMALAANVSRIGNLIEIANKAIQTFTGPLFGLFLLGMFSARARSTGALVGGIVGTTVSVYVAFGTKIGFIWPTVFGLASTLIVGYFISIVSPGSDPVEKRRLTWWNVVRAPALILALLIAGVASPAGAQEIALPTPAQAGPSTTPLVEKDYAHILHVSATGSDDAGDGSRAKPWASPEHALKHITDAAKDRRYAITIAEGTYPARSLQSKPHVDLLGGFNPADWTRDVARHATILDGENAGRVLIGADNAAIDGFVIRNGRVNGPGGAILCDQTSPRINNNCIVENVTIEPEHYLHGLLHQIGNDGGAIACINGASPTIEHNLIARNRTGVGNGGGIACRNFGSAVIVNNVIVENITGQTDKNRSRSSNGAGISAVNAKPRIAGNVILNNRVGGNGDAGGIYCEYDASAEITRNVIVGNVAEDDGGAIYVMKSSEPVIDSNIIAGNKGGGAIRLSKEGRGQICNNIVFGNTTGDINCVASWMVLANNTVVDNVGRGIGYENHSEHLRASIIVNNIFYGNDAKMKIDGKGERPVVSHSLVQGGQAGDANFDGDPHFVDDAVNGAIESVRFDAASCQTTLAVARLFPKGWTRARSRSATRGPS
jgi:SSS family transporter